MNNEITKYLNDWQGGDTSALEELLPAVYDELYKIAHSYRSKENTENTLQTNDIINEAYLKMIKTSDKNWQSRSHFFAFASRVMRSLLVDHARKKKYQKRGGDAVKVNLEDVAVFSPLPDNKILALDESLKNLAEFDERKSRIVELRYFGGLTAKEVAEVIGVSEITVKREWQKAKIWLYNAIS